MGVQLQQGIVLPCMGSTWHEAMQSMSTTKEHTHTHTHTHRTASAPPVCFPLHRDLLPWHYSLQCTDTHTNVQMRARTHRKVQYSTLVFSLAVRGGGPNFSSQTIISPWRFAYGLLENMGTRRWLRFFKGDTDRQAPGDTPVWRALYEKTR